MLIYLRSKDKKSAFMIYKIAEKKLVDIYQQLKSIEATIDRGPDHAVQRQAKAKLGKVAQGTAKGHQSLTQLGKKIVEIDKQLQATVACDPKASKLIKAKHDCQRVFARVFEKYSKKVDHAPKEKSTSNAILRTNVAAENGLQGALRAIKGALSKIEAQKIHGKNLKKGAIPTVKDLVPFAKHSSALYDFYRICASIMQLPSHQRNKESIKKKLADAFLKLPRSLRHELLGKLGIKSIAQIKIGKKETDTEKVIHQLEYLSVEDCSLLQTRLENSSNHTHRKSARLVQEFETNQKKKAQAFAEKDASAILKVLEGIAKKRVATCGFTQWKEVFSKHQEAMQQESADAPEESELLQMLKNSSLQPKERVALLSGGKQAALIEHIKQTQKKERVVFEQFYSKALVFLHRPILEDHKKEAIQLLINRLPQEMRKQLFKKIFELSPNRKTTKGWPERHALDNWAILLAAANAFCPSKKEHLFHPFLKSMQKIVHNHKIINPTDLQSAVKTLLQEIKASVPADSWDQFKTEFFNRFEGQEKWHWGFGGEEYRAHEYPYHVLSTLHAMISPSSQPEYWNRLLGHVQIRSSQVKKAPVSKNAMLWQCYNAIDGYGQARSLGELRQMRFFAQMWQMSPLCKGLKNGEATTIDRESTKEIALRLNILEVLETVRESMNKRYSIDPAVWKALIYRIILQDVRLSKTDGEGIRAVILALKELETDTTYDSNTAKEIVHLLIDMTSRRLLSGNLRQAMALKDVQQAAFMSALQAKPLDQHGPNMFKLLTYFKDETGKFLGKLKPLDPAMGNKGKYKVEHFFREIASSQINDALGLDITVPTIAFRHTLGEAIRKLAERYMVDPSSAEKLFASIHPFLREAIEKQSPGPWKKLIPSRKLRYCKHSMLKLERLLYSIS